MASISLIKLPELIQKLKLSKSTIYLYISRGDFPKPISLGERSVAWIEQDVIDWLEQRIADSQTNDIQGGSNE